MLCIPNNGAGGIFFFDHSLQDVMHYIPVLM